MEQTLTGTIERVTFHNPDNGFVVLRALVAGRRGPVVIVGNAARAVAGEWVEARGVWKDDPERGPQFQAQSLRTAPPSTLEGIEKYLGSGLVKGIGPHFAKKIVAVFGPRTLQVIDESPTYLSEIKGIGAKRIQRIRESWRQQKTVRDILVFLQSHGVGAARAVRIYKTYGDQALDLVRANPYRLANDIWGVGFQTADELAGRLGIDRQSPLRAQAALRYVLLQASFDGHCALPQNELLDTTQALTGIAIETVNQSLEKLVGLKEVIRARPFDDDWIYPLHLHQAEVEVAGGLQDLLVGPHPLSKLSVNIAETERSMKIDLAPAQRDALSESAQRKLLVITGGPGVGKTTIVRGILDIFERARKTVLLAAPTGRAAKRLAETTGRPAKTLHRLLEFEAGKSQCRRNPDSPLDADLVLVDETSMVDIVLMRHLVRAVPQQACLILVGDVDQLPSVGPGRVLGDILDSRAIPSVRLTEVFRQAQESGIVQAAHSILHGELPTSATPERPGDFYHIEADTPERIQELIVTMIRDRIPKRFGLDPLTDVQVLTPMNKGDLGTRQLNQHLQNVFNPARQDAVQAERFGIAFRVGDKVLQTANDYEKDVFNGDIGRVAKIDRHEEILTVSFENRDVEYEFDELDELALAYALTIHKSQGSEYPAVVIPLHTQHFVMLRRNLLYTAITRGKKLVVLVGPTKAVRMAIGQAETLRRFTGLSALLNVEQAPG